MTNARSRTVLGAAIAVAIVGVALGIRPFLPSRTLAPSTSAPPADAPVALPIFSLPIQPDFETAVTSENISEVAASLRDRSRSVIQGQPDVAGLGLDATERLLASIEEQSHIYLGGSFDARLDFLNRTGARYPMLDDARASGDAARLKDVEDSLRTFWSSVTEPVALNPISLEEVTVRARFVNGRPIRYADDRYAMAINTSPDRWPTLAGDPEVNPYTIVEWMVPVFYVLPPDVQSPAYFAIWFIWDAGAKDWKIHQTRIYSPLRQALPVVPSM